MYRRQTAYVNFTVFFVQILSGAIIYLSETAELKATPAKPITRFAQVYFPTQPL